MNKFSNRNEFKSSLIGLFGSILLAYSLLVLANFILEVYLFYLYPGFHVYTNPEPAETVLEAVEQAKDETIQVVTRKPIQFTFVAILCGIGVFIILYGPWE
jgi:hypothetical protein